jgi:hypothetical protein
MAVKLRLMHGLPIIDIDVIFAGRRLHLKNILLDTGSAGTILDADLVSEIGVKPEGSDKTAIIHGIGGTEIVFTKWFDSVILGDWSVNTCKIEIGAMDYGLDIQGILGFDFIRTVGLIIDTEKMQIYSAN